jgi:flagellar biosynthesis GTPase FlhF
VKEKVRGLQDSDGEDELRSILDGRWGIEDDSSVSSESDISTVAEEVKISYGRQRAVLLGRSLSNFNLVDFLEDVPDDVLRRLLESCTQVQRAQVNDFVRRVPCGVLPILGAAGVGKATFVSKIDNHANGGREKGRHIDCV